jgi:hypothetical protein
MVALIAERDSYHCARCGRAAPAYKRQIHHRKPRGLGGRKAGPRGSGTFGPGPRPKAKDVDFPENLVLLCGSISTDPQSCHYHVENYRSLALSEGWLCHEWEDPRDKPILARDGEWHLLVDDQWDPMLLPVTWEIPRAKRWARGEDRDAQREEWLRVHSRANLRWESLPRDRRPSNGDAST